MRRSAAGTRARRTVVLLAVAVLVGCDASEPTRSDPTSSATGDDPTGDEPTGDDETSDDPTGDEPTGDDATSDDPTGDEPTGDDDASRLDVVLTDVSELVEEVADGVVAVSQGRFRFDDLVEPVIVPAGVGTGIVIDDEGHVLTNYHVIQGAQAVLITSRDGTERDAIVIGEAPELDLALLEVADAAGLEPIAFGASDDLEVGDPVVAIGNALGLDRTAPTVSVGIVSARDRTLRAPDGTVLQGLLQTDAAINPGNSGGPLLNRSGELVGINTAILGNAQNLGFAIALDDAKPVIEQFLSGLGGPYLGVQLIDNTPQLAAQFGLAVAEGAVIVDVTPGPGFASGLRPGDIVVAAGGDPVRSAAELIDVIGSTEPERGLDLDVVRGSERIVVDVTVGRRPALVD